MVLLKIDGTCGVVHRIPLSGCLAIGAAQCVLKLRKRAGHFGIFDSLNCYRY